MTGDTNMNNDTLINFGATFPQIPEGTWPFRITQAEVERNCPTAYGIRDRVRLTYSVRVEGEDNPLRQRYLASNAPKSKFYELVLALLGSQMGRAFDVSSLEGISGLAVITHNTSESGDVYANISEIVDVDRDDAGVL